MTLKELIKLDEEGGIPDFLKKKWEERHGEDPIEIARAHLRNNQIEGIVLCAFILVLVLLTVSFCFSVKFEIFPSILVGLVSAAGVGMMIFSWKDRFVPHESSTQVGKFAQNFGELRAWINPDWEMSRSTLEGSLRAWADNFLVLSFRIALEFEKKSRINTNQKSVEKIREESNVALQARRRFGRLHQTLFELGLADKEWNRYAKAAQAQLEAKRS